MLEKDTPISSAWQPWSWRERTRLARQWHVDPRPSSQAQNQFCFHSQAWHLSRLVVLQSWSMLVHGSLTLSQSCSRIWMSCLTQHLTLLSSRGKLPWALLLLAEEGTGWRFKLTINISYSIHRHPCIPSCREPQLPRSASDRAFKMTDYYKLHKIYMFAGRWQCMRPAWPTEQVTGQPGLQRNSASKGKTKTRKKKKRKRKKYKCLYTSLCL